MKSLKAAAMLVFWVGVAGAQDTLKTLPMPPSIEFSAGIFGTIVKLLLALAVVVGLIYVSIFLLKRLSGRSLSDTEQLIKVVGKSYLTPKQSLYIVKLGLKYAVLGVGENSVNLIKELTSEELESLKPTTDNKPRNFQDVLKSMLKK
jgi:flagellar biosynthetic protein FliO